MVRLLYGPYFSVPSHLIPWQFIPVPSNPWDVSRGTLLMEIPWDVSHGNDIPMDKTDNIEYRLPQTITKIKQKKEYDVTAANAHPVKTAPLFHKLYKKGCVYLLIYPVSHHKTNNRYKYIRDI